MTGADDNFLSRWSRRKHAAARGEAPAPAPETRPAAPVAPAQAVSGATKAEVPLPSVESLTPESDFSPFMQEDADPLLRRQALKTLFLDPRFNVMDGLDTYIDDYSKPDPIPAEWLGRLNQMARLGDYKPPETPATEPEKAADDPASPPIQAENQGLVEDPALPPSDTPDTGSPEQESRQS